MTLLIALASGFVVGISLGLTGSGGSLFAIPLLLLIVGLEMSDAVPVSMLVVGMTALVGAISAFRKKLLLTRPTLIFGISGMLAAPVGLMLGEIVPENSRIFGFSLLAIVIALRMAWQSFTPENSRVVRAGLELDDPQGICRYSPDGQMRFSVPCAIAITISGAIVGILSGFFGVGGGFLIVPVLMYVIRMNMQFAVGSSLAIIAMIGLSGGVVAGISVLVSQTPALLFGGGSLLGMLSGRSISGKLAGPRLQQIFAAALLITGVVMIFQLLSSSHVL